MTDIAQLGFAVDTGGLRTGERGLNSYAATGERTERRMGRSVSTMNKDFFSLKKVIGLVGVALTTLGSGKKLLDVTREFDVLNAQLITATGNAENAAVAFGAIQKFAATTPYDLAQATKAFTQLVNLGLTPSEAALQSYGNTASAMGKDLSQLVEAVADAATGEFERLKEFGIKAKSEGDNVSFTFRGVKTTVKKEAAEIEQYLIALGENEFAGAMEQRSRTLDGAISNLGDSWDSLFLTVSKQGVGDAMQSGVIEAANQIEALDNYIAAGAFSNSLKAVIGRFDGWVSDVNYTMNFVSQIIGDSADEWIDDTNRFFDNMYEGLKILPELTRFFIQAAVVSLAKFVDYAAIYGKAFSDVMSASFDRIMDRAEIIGQSVRNSLNPFADSYDSDLLLESVERQYETTTALIMKSANEQADAASAVAESVILGYALQTEAATKSTDAQLEESEKLLSAFLDRKNAIEGDQLAQFKVNPVSTGTGEVDTKAVEEYAKWLEKITSESTIGQLQDIADEIEKTMKAFDAGLLSESAAFEYIDELEKRAMELKGVLSGSDMFNAISSSAIDGLKSIQSLSEQGSSEYAKLGIAVQAVTALQAVQAVVNQAAGTNPYESFAKMAAMVAALGSLGVSVGGLSSGFSDDSADNQANQGLNSFGEKSESISNSIDMTANATDKLVSINTNMLSALQNLSDDIAKAVNLSLRDGTVDNLQTSVSVNENLFDSFGLLGSKLESVVGFLSGGLLGGLLSNTLFDKIGSFLGGSSSTTDRGIEVAGGTLGALVTDADVDAYIDTKYKTWRFGSTKRRTDYADLDDASAQFSLVFASLADSVYEGATALGLSSEAVTEAVNAFEIQTFQISLKDLSVDEQQAEVEAVFASIFDDLSLAIVPYLSEFQELGEGYGETLARVATEVGIAEVLVDRLGITLGDKLADPQMYLTIASNLSNLAGGIDDFADKTSSFIDAFAPDSVKLDIYTSAMVDALTGVGLALPDTTEEFFNLLQGLDATTDAGQQQVATLLNLTDTAEEYYGLLDSTVGSFNNSLQSLTASIMSTIDSMFGITYEDALTSLDDSLLLARAGSFDSALGLDLNSLGANESDFSSLADFNIAQARTGNKLADLAALTGETMTTADYALNESIEQTSLLKSLKEGIAKANELLTNQNRLQADSAESLDTINNKTGYA